MEKQFEQLEEIRQLPLSSIMNSDEELYSAQ